MKGPARIDMEKKCWCGATFKRRLDERCKAFRARECCCEEHRRTLAASRKTGTPWEKDRSLDIACTACHHARLDPDIDFPCNRCKDGSAFKRNPNAKKIPQYKERSDDES